MDIVMYIFNLITKTIVFFLFLYFGLMFGTKERRRFTRNTKKLKKQEWFNRIIKNPTFILVHNDSIIKLIAEIDVEEFSRDPQKIKDFEQKLLSIIDQEKY